MFARRSPKRDPSKRSSCLQASSPCRSMHVGHKVPMRPSVEPEDSVDKQRGLSPSRPARRCTSTSAERPASTAVARPERTATRCSAASRRAVAAPVEAHRTSAGEGTACPSAQSSPVVAGVVGRQAFGRGVSPPYQPGPVARGARPPGRMDRAAPATAVVVAELVASQEAQAPAAPPEDTREVPRASARRG